MPMQAKAEGVKLFHAKAQLWALLGFVLVLLWFANSGTMYFMVAGDLLNPLDSIGFFKDVAMGSGRSGLQLVRSSQSLTVFSWLIPVNLCVAQFASERRARTDELFVSHGGRLSTLYSAKFGVVCGFCLLLQLAFYGICFIITAIQMGIAPALGTVLLFCAVSVGNLLVLGAFLALTSVLTLWLKNHAAAALVTSILPLAGVLLYQVQYEDFSTQPFLIQLAAKAMPTYYWSRLCALNITPQFCVEFVAWVIVALAVAAGLGWMALHRPDAGKQRSARKAHAVLRRREKSAARQGMHRASTFSAALYALRCTRLPGMLALFSLLCMAFALGVSESRIVDATWADGRRVGIFPGGSLPVGSAADAALGTVLSVGILAWIAVILVVVMAFHQNKTAGAARLAVAHGVSRVRYMVGSFAAETIMLQGWYMVLYFLLSVVTGALSQPGRTAFFWMQSAWILQASYAVVWLVCRLCSSELAGATFCFVVTLAGVIVSVSAPDPAAVSPLSALLFYATPMPYWLALGGGVFDSLAGCWLWRRCYRLVLGGSAGYHDSERCGVKVASVYSGTKYLRKTSNSIILELTNFAGGLSMDVSVGTRLRVLRKDAGLTQAQLAALAGTNQAAINRYETDRAAAPYRILVWYATYFNVSLDYIFGLCEDPRGQYVCVTPEEAQEVVQRKPDWSEFVEACFTPGSELNRRLKQMILNMGEEEKHK